MYVVIIENSGAETILHDSRSPERSPVRIVGGKVVKGINSIDSFTFTVYPNNPAYDMLYGLRTKIRIICGKNNKAVFIGRVLTAADSMSENGLICKSVTCEGRLGWLCDTLQPYGTYTVSDLRNVLQSFLTEHNRNTDDKKIYTGQVTVNASNNYTYVKNWDTTLQTISDKLIDKFGGELQLRDADGKVYLDYLDRIGRGTDTIIKLAVNLKSVKREIDETSVITRFYPLGAKLSDSEDRVRIGSVNNGLDYLDNDELIAKYGVIVGCETWDDVTEPKDLIAKGKAYFAAMNKTKVQYSITALDLSAIGMELDEFELGNTYRIINPLMEIDDELRIIGITLDLDSPYKSALTFGDKFETMTGLTAKKSKSFAAKLEESEFRNMDVINSKVENATQLITGASGGHVILDPSEKPERILIMDTADINTCKSCIQLNKNGLGFWKVADGGSAKNGPYTNAWTIDGNLVASFITALTLTGLKINNGSGTFKVDEYGRVTAKALDMQGGSINVQTSDQSTDVIKLSHNEWTMEISPLQINITNSTIGGSVKLQAGAIFGYWNDEMKFSLDTNSGSIRSYTNGGKPVFFLDTNNRFLTMYDSSGKRTAYIDAENGTIASKYQGTISD